MIPGGIHTSHREPGRFFGRTVGCRRVSEMTVSEVCYPPGLQIPRHDHELASVCFVIEGTYEEHYGLRHRVCREGMVVVRPAGEQHADSHHGAAVRLLSVEIDGPRLESLREAAPVLSEPRDYLSSAMTGLAGALLREFRGSETASNLAIEALLLELIVESCRGAHWRETREERAAPAWMTRAEDFLRANFVQPISLGDLARAAGVHPAHIARTFRRRHGQTVGGYVRRLRLETARVQLANDTCSLAEIAGSCGFADQSHFTRLFRAAYGVTPAAFRREARNG